MTLTRAQVLGLIETHHLKPGRALGQNFVADPNTVRRIARLAEVGPRDRVLEIGAGLGSLTLALAETGACITAVEKDRWLIPVLEQVLARRAPGSAVRVVAADAMRTDWDVLLAPSLGWVVVANLPYNIATPLIAQLLDNVPAIGRMLVLVQEEVALRLVASPGDAAYGAVSVKIAYWAEAGLAGSVPPSVFIPRPNVGSALVRIQRRPTPALDPAAIPADLLFGLVRAGFATRRKMLRGALAGIVRPSAFEMAGIDPTWRAERLGLHDWGRLATAVAVTSVAGGDAAGDAHSPKVGSR